MLHCKLSEDINLHSFINAPHNPYPNPLCSSASARYQPSAQVSTDQKAGLKRESCLNHSTSHAGILLHLEILRFCWNAVLKDFLWMRLSKGRSQKHLCCFPQCCGRSGCAAQPSWALFLSPKPGGGALPDNCSPLAPRASGGFTHHMGFLWSLISSKKSHFATSGTLGPQLLSFSLTFSWVTGLYKSNLRFLDLSKAAGKPA